MENSMKIEKIIDEIKEAFETIAKNNNLKYINYQNRIN